MALEADKTWEMLDGKQREKALVGGELPVEQAVGFRGTAGKFPGIAIADLTSDQKEQVQKTIAKILEPYRNTDQQEALECLKKQGGLDKCSLAFYAAGDLGDDSQ